MIRRINNASVSIFFLIILNGLFNRKVSNVNAQNLRRGASDDAMGEQIQNDRSLIIGGDEARDFPRSIVFLSDRVDDLQCGGTLISPTIVLAAGHCEISLVTEAVFNRFSYIPLDKRKSNFKDNGSISNEEIRIKVKEEIQHPEYKRRGFHNDVMLVVLERSPNDDIDVIEEPLLERANGNSSDDPNENFDERPWRDANSPDESHDESHDEVTQQIPKIPYMKLHMSSHPTLDDLADALESSQSERRDRSHRFYQYGDRPKTTPLKLKALGWGHTANGQGSEPSEVLREVAVSYVRNEVCNEAAENAVISYEGKITDDMMCTWHPGRDTCHGDSGGPIILENPNKGHGEKFIQVGIVSWGEDCADEIFPGVASRVSESFDWIRDRVCSIDGADAPQYFGCTDEHTYSPAPSTSPTTFLDGFNTEQQLEQTTPVRIQIDLDVYSKETGWRLVDDAENEVIHSVGYKTYEYENNIEVDFDLTVGKRYKFTIYDEYGDGISNKGGYKIYTLVEPPTFRTVDNGLPKKPALVKGEVIVEGDGDFRSKREEEFTVPGPPVSEEDNEAALFAAAKAEARLRSGRQKHRIRQFIPRQ